MGLPRPAPVGPTPPERAATLSQATPEFEEYSAPPRLDEHGRPLPKARGLRGASAPTASTAVQEPLTKANLAKGFARAPDTLPPPAPSVPEARRPPAMDRVDATEAFDEYRRPGAEEAMHPLGLRQDPLPAREILRHWKEPEPEVVTPRRFLMEPVPPAAAPAAEPYAEEPPALPAPSAALPPSTFPPILRQAVQTPPMSAADGPAPDPFRLDRRPEPAPLPAPAPAAPAAAQPPAAPVPARAAAPAPARPAAPHGRDAPPLPSGSGAGARVAIVQARFNQDITDAMVSAAKERAAQLGCTVAAVHAVAGVFETPLAALRLAEREDVDAVVAIACVIQGETGHDEVITHAAAKALLDVALSTGKPVGFGVTGPRMTRVQALARIPHAAHAVDAVVEALHAMA